MTLIVGVKLLTMGLLENHVAVITGAGSGIGAATARLFAKEGARLVLLYFDEASGISIERQINEKGYQAKFIRCDVSREGEVKHAFDLAEKLFGTVF